MDNWKATTRVQHWTRTTKDFLTTLGMTGTTMSMFPAVVLELFQVNVVDMRIPAWYRVTDFIDIFGGHMLPQMSFTWSKAQMIINWALIKNIWPNLTVFQRKTCLCSLYLHLTSLKCVLIYSRLRWCNSVQPISSAKRAMPMTLLGSRCLVRKSQHALATSSIWYLVEKNGKKRKVSLLHEYPPPKGIINKCHFNAFNW